MIEQRIATVILISTSLIFIMFYILMRNIRQNVLFCPTKTIKWIPSPDISYKNVLIESGNNKINGWLFENHPGRPIILYSHGNYGNVSYRKMIYELAEILEMNLFMYDYSGYGRSTGTASLDQFHKDADSAYRFLRQNVGYKPDDIYILGKSLGGYASLSIASNHPVRSVIVICTFNTFEDIIEHDGNRTLHIMKKLARFMTDNYQQNNDFVKKIKKPCVFLHSKKDKKIPFRNSLKLYEDCKALKKKFIEIDGDHTSISIDYEKFISALTFAEYPIKDLMLRNDFHKKIKNWLKKLPGIVKTMATEMSNEDNKIGNRITNFIVSNLMG